MYVGHRACGYRRALWGDVRPLDKDAMVRSQHPEDLDRQLKGKGVLSAIAFYRHPDSELLACPVPRAQPNRLFISTAGALLAVSLSLSCQSKLDRPGAEARSSWESTDPQTPDLIATVKDVSASSLERGLPAVRFEDWVRANAGSEWTITWRFSKGPKNAANHIDFPDSVDVRGDTEDGRYFRLSIGTTTTNANQVLLFWLSGAANVQHGWVGLEHLSQLPRLLHHTSQSSHTSEGATVVGQGPPKKVVSVPLKEYSYPSDGFAIKFPYAPEPHLDSIHPDFKVWTIDLTQRATISIRLKMDSQPCNVALEKLKSMANVPIREFTVSGRPAWEEKEWRHGDSMVFERYVCGEGRYYVLTLGWSASDPRPQLGVEIMDSFRLVK